jgi:DNA-nicking Smr family endonuclease
MLIVKNGQLRSDEIDLHGLFVQEAIEKAEERIDQCKRQGVDHLIIIVGRGNHSIGE